MLRIVRIARRVPPRLASLFAAGLLVALPVRAAEPASASVGEDAAALRASAARRVTALGRLEPKGGIVRLAGSSQTAIFVNVVAKLLVAPADRVEPGQVVARFDTYEWKQAAVARLRVELAGLERDRQRFEDLYREGVVAALERDAWRTKVEVARAALRQAEADLELALVRSPIRGRVIEIHAYPGERVGEEGLLELGDTDEMYAVAEVYESDVANVRIGQHAVVTSESFGGELRGTVDEIAWKIGKKDVLDTDPAAKTDARVVEVKVRLDDGEPVARFSNMQVEVAFLPGS